MNITNDICATKNKNIMDENNNNLFNLSNIKAEIENNKIIPDINGKNSPKFCTKKNEKQIIASL